jgi:hypothetical protein
MASKTVKFTVGTLLLLFIAWVIAMVRSANEN